MAAPAAKPTLVVVGAQKGGVGKTTTSRLLIHWLEQQKRQFQAFDTEYPNGSLHRFYPNVSDIVDINQTEGQMKIFDPLLAETNMVYVIDLRANLLFNFMELLEDLFIMRDVREGAFKMVFMHVLGGTMESLQEVGQTLSRFEGARHVAVRNAGTGGNFDVWEDSDLRQTFLAKKGIELNIPALDPVAYHAIDRTSAGFQDFIANRSAEGAKADHSYVLRAYVRHWLLQCDLQMDKLKL